MKINTIKYGVFIGRSNPPHVGHISIINKAIQENDKVIVVVGSHKSTLNPKKLFTTEEVVEMIKSGVADASKLIFAYVRDNLYSDNEWVLSVRKQISNAVSNSNINKDKTSITLYGYDKDQSSQYLKWFSHYNFVECSSVYAENTNNIIHATDVRKYLYETWLAYNYNTHTECVSAGSFSIDIEEKLRPIMTEPVFNKMIEIFKRDNCERLHWVANEYQSYVNYKKQWENAPFAPTFVTGDAVVFCNGHILLVRRKKSPGRGNFALPGGFLNVDEPIRNCILRELREETKIDVPPGKLTNSLKEVVVFDAPGRSQRGRTITNAGLIILDEVKLPKVKGADDAEKAEWIPLDILPSIEDQFFEDHYHIITMMKGKLG